MSNFYKLLILITLINHNASIASNIMLFEFKPRITKFEHITYPRHDSYTTGCSSDRQRVMYKQDESTKYEYLIQFLVLKTSLLNFLFF